MSTATRRAASRKAMRVATCFTGAAAAAVAFAPAALAAPGNAAAQGHTGLVNGKTQAVRPDITSKGCGASDVQWLHISYASMIRSHLCKAFGFTGYKADGQDMQAQCGGNNYGTIFSAKGTDIGFGPGNTYRAFNPRKNISGVSIYYWSGKDKCAWPR